MIQRIQTIYLLVVAIIMTIVRANRPIAYPE
jgi:hypothetical protein